MEGGEKLSFKQRQISERKKLILTVARRMFVERGYHGTNLNDVASEIGIARGTIYLHFPTKDDLLAEIIRNADEELLNALNDVIKPKDDPLEKLRKIFKAYFVAYQKYEDLIRVASFELRNVIGDRLYGSRKNRSVTDLVQETIEEAKQKGFVDSKINTMLAAHAFFSVVTIQTLQEAREDKGLKIDEILDSASRIYFHGIIKREVEQC